MSGHTVPSVRPDARDALDRFSFGNSRVHKLLADLAADHARTEDADCVTEAHVKAAARTLAMDQREAAPDTLGAVMTRQGIGQAAPRRTQVLPAWLAEPVEAYGAIVLAIGVVATAGWVAVGYSETPSTPPSAIASPATAPLGVAPIGAIPAASPQPDLAAALPAMTPAPVPLVSVPVPVPPVSMPEPPATASADEPAPLPIPPRKLPIPPVPRSAPDPATTPGTHRHYLVRIMPRERDPLPPRERVESEASAPRPTLSAFQNLVRRFSRGAEPAPEEGPRPPPVQQQQRFIGSYVMGPNGTRQFVPDP